MNIIPIENGFTFLDHTFTYDLEGKHPYEKVGKNNSIQTNLGIFEFHLNMTIDGIKYSNYEEFYNALFPTW